MEVGIGFPVSIGKHPLPLSLQLCLLRSAPSHSSCILSTVPLLSLCKASSFFSHANARWSPRIWSSASKNPSEHPGFPSSLCCMRIYLSQILLPGLWSCLLQEGLMIRWCFLDAFGCSRRWREKNVRLLSLTKHWGCSLVRSQAPAVSKPVS